MTVRTFTQSPTANGSLLWTPSFLHVSFLFSCFVDASLRSIAFRAVCRWIWNAYRLFLTFNIVIIRAIIKIGTRYRCSHICVSYHVNVCTVRITSICVLLYVSYYVFRVVSSCRPSVGPSTGHIIGLIEPADSDLVTSDSACALNSCWLIFRLIFLSCFFLPFPYVSFLFFLSSFWGVNMYYGYVPGIISLHVILDGIP